MSSSTDTTTTQCATCQNPGSKICSGCKQTPSLDGKIESVVYCSTKCQQEAWLAHKDECKSRKARLVVFRVGSTLTKIFYVFREKLFDRTITRIERESGKLLIYEGPVPDPVTSYDYLQPFPDHMVENDEERHSLSSHLSCNDAVGWMHNLIRHILTGVVAEVHEHSVKAKATKGGLMTVNKHGVKKIGEEKLEHNILQIVLKDGSSYAFDPTCAQYGYFEPVINWKDYRNTRIASFASGAGSGNNFGRVKMLLLMAAGDSQNFTENVFWNNQMASIRMKDAIMAWEEGEGLKIRDMCKLPEADFAAKQKHLLMMVSWALDGFLTELRLQHEAMMGPFAPEEVGKVASGVTYKEVVEVASEQIIKELD